MLNLVVLGARGATPPFSRRSYDEERCGLLLCLPVFLCAFAFSSASTTGGFAWALASTLCFAGTFYLFLETWDYLTANVPSGRITLKLRITNGYQNDLNRTSHVSFSGNAYVEKRVQLPSLAQGASCVINYELVPTGWAEAGGPGDRAAIDEMPATLTFAFDSRDRTSVTVPMNFAWFTGGLRKPFLPPLIERVTNTLTRRSDADPSRLNVLIFGEAGSGKSSFINSVTNMLHGNMQTRKAGGLGKHKTVKLAYTDIQDIPLCMIDTVGLTTENYKGEELELIMSGRQEHGAKMGDRRCGDMAAALSPECIETARMRAPDAVFVVMDPSRIDNETFLTKLKDEVAKIHQMDYMPILVMSKFDDGEEADCVTIRENPSNPSARQKETLEQARKALDVRADNAFILVNYQTPTRQFELDRNIYRILYHGLSCARDRKACQRETRKDYQPSVKLPFVDAISAFIRGKSGIELFGMLAMTAAMTALLVMARSFIYAVIYVVLMNVLMYVVPSAVLLLAGAAAIFPPGSIGSPPPSGSTFGTVAHVGRHVGEATHPISTPEGDVGDPLSSAKTVREAMEDVQDRLTTSFPDNEAPAVQSREPPPPSFESLGTENPCTREPSADSVPLAFGVPVAASA